MHRSLLSFLLWAGLLVSNPILAELQRLVPRAERPRPIGIQRDQEPQVDFPMEHGTYFFSYSGIIEYPKGLVRPACGGITNFELHNLAWVAFKEMRDLHPDDQGNHLPGAMAALAHGQRIYFASSMKSNWPTARPAHIAENLDADDNVSEYMTTYLMNNAGTASIHRTGGCCAEPNVIRLFHESGGNGIPDPNKFIVINAINRAETKHPDHPDHPANQPIPPIPQGADSKVVAPCKDVPGTLLRGCETTFKRRYRLQFVDEEAIKDTDPTIQFEFTPVQNPRPAEE